MLEEKVYKVFLKYVIPSLFGLLAISSASIIDGYFVGNYVGSIGLASINISYPIFAILFGFGLMFAVGNSVLVSKLIGEKKTQDASNLFSKAIISVSVSSVILCFLLYLNIDNIFYFLQIENELRLSSKSYLSVILIFLPFLMSGIVLDYFVRVDENPNLSFIALLLSAVINILLDYIFIVKLDYAIEGAAYATGISQAFIIIILLPHFFSKKAKLRFIRPKGSFMDTFKALKNGFSEFINESSAGITVLIFNFMMLKYLGSNGVAAYTIVGYFLMINIMISFAISDGLQPIISKHFGAKEFLRIKKFLKLAFMSVLGISSILVLFVLSYPELLVNVFLKDENSAETTKITIEFLHYTWLAFIFIGLNILITSYLTAIHQEFASTCISLFRSLIFPILFVSVLSYYFGLKGVYIALPLSEICTFVLAFYFFKKHYNLSI